MGKQLRDGPSDDEGLTKKEVPRDTPKEISKPKKPRLSLIPDSMREGQSSSKQAKVGSTSKTKEKSGVKASTADKTITITFGDCAENHVGMQQIGTLAEVGFSVEDLKAIMKDLKERFPEADIEFYDLNTYLPETTEGSPAAVLVVRKGVDLLLSSLKKTADDLKEEQDTLTPDTQFFDRRRKKVLNKHARYNLCFADEPQQADFEEGKGTVVAWEKVGLLKHIRDHLHEFLGEKGKNLEGEGNYYYNPAICGIGFHGDTERRKVVGIRLGETIPLHYQWFVHHRPIGERAKFSFDHGDFYVMSEKASGFDWKSSIKPTLRHAAGAKKYLTINKK